MSSRFVAGMQVDDVLRAAGICPSQCVREHIGSVLAKQRIDVGRSHHTLMSAAAAFLTPRRRCPSQPVARGSDGVSMRSALSPSGAESGVSLSVAGCARL